MIEVLAQGERRARKPHQCFDCYRKIGVGELHGYGTYKYDDVYTLRYHLDCKKAAWAFFDFSGFEPFDEGYPPLRDALCEDEYRANIEWLRGRFPHVACRMELTDQLREHRK
ncbi:hypothetical protein [uncultured Mameliella sp.]|uniref:hypothetical protein n=1 Tax=uncultured Mameliella sp. TaxID=1447087 RepID=UPI00261049CD|nr:hypothetical protein [uncultured Mameliella sp.]